MPKYTELSLHRYCIVINKFEFNIGLIRSFWKVVVRKLLSFALKATSCGFQLSVFQPSPLPPTYQHRPAWKSTDVGEDLVKESSDGHSFITCLSLFFILDIFILFCVFF